MQGPSVGIYLDKRYTLATGLYAVKISLTFKRDGKTKQLYLSTGIELSADDFKRVTSEKYLTKELKAITNKLTEAKAKAISISKDTPWLSPDQFKSIYFGKTVSASTLKYFFDLKIQEHYTRNTTQGEATAISYQGALKTIQDFSPGELLLANIDIDWLTAFEKYLMDKDYSATTVAIYMRYIRAVFNLAIEHKLINHDSYPFGRKKYQIPHGNNIKKTLNQKDLNKLLNYQHRSKIMQRHLLFWKLCYYCVGINFKDMALLKKENLAGDVLTYYRQKTAATRRTKKPIIIPLHPKAKEIIKQLIVPGAEYLFDIINDDMTPQQQYKTITNWRRNAMTYIKKIVKDLGISENIVIYTARHTSANNLLTNNIDLATLQDLLGHTSLASTQHYTSGLPFSKKKHLIIKAL